MKPKKVPAAAARTTPQRQARFSEQGNSLFPAWQFSTVDKSGPFAWPCGKAEELEVLQKLSGFDSMRWDEIEGKRHHSIELESLSKDAQRRLEEIQQDDVAAVFSFALEGAMRVIGIRDRGVVKLLWFDPEHAVCPSHKKHT